MSWLADIEIIQSAYLFNPCFSLRILRVWESLSEVTCCRSLIVVYDSRCVLQIGFAAKSSIVDGESVAVDADKLMQGSLCQGVIKSGARKLFGWTSYCSLEVSSTWLCHKLGRMSTKTYNFKTNLFDLILQRATWPTYLFILGSLSCHFCLQIPRCHAWTQLDFARQAQGLKNIHFKASLIQVALSQAVILQPLGEKGIAIIGGDTIRGFTTSDQVLLS